MQNLLPGIGGIPFLLLGASLLVKNGIDIAKHLKISPFFIGLTVLSIGTSIPEIFTHIVSSVEILIHPENREILAGVAIGTNIGSNIVQITAIVGIVGLLGTIRSNRTFMYRDYLVMLAGILLLWFFALTGEVITQWEGWVLMMTYGVYLWYLTSLEKIDDKIDGNPQYHPLRSCIMILVGLTMVILSANAILDTAVWATEAFGISGSLIGAVIIGVATALPELTTSLIAVKRKSNGLSVGTLVGSNITNPLLGIGIGAAITPLPVDSDILNTDLPFWFIISLIGWIFFWTDLRVSRNQASLLIGAYIAYLYFRVSF